ncbi:MAG: hypothetical protein QOG80_2747, partial [Pseudonocardiales bacterium]|nr:hypothetical protein [Pseudonocardiales bacterium]
MVPTRWTRWTQERAATAYTGTVLAGFAAVVLGPSLLGFRTLISVNTLTGYFPWRADGVQVVGHERCTGDTIDTVMPSIAYIRGEWLHGHLGAWQSLIGGGSAVGALPSDGLLDPLSLPYFVLPLWLAPAFVKLLEILVGGGGTYLFLRRLGVSRPAGMIAGAVFATSGFMVMWTNWPQTRVAALIPALFWAIERLVQRLRFSDAALIALVVASIVLGGFPSVTAWALEAGALYFVVRLVVEYRDNLRTAGRALGLGVGGLAVGGLLAMIELLPFAKVYSDVSGQRSGYGLTPLAAVRLVTLISPGAYGLCVGGEPKYDGSSPIEDVAFVGAAAMLLAVVGACVRLRLNARRADGGSAPRVISGRGVTMFFAATAVVIVLIGWSSSTFLRHLQFLPPFHGNPVGRIRAVLGFALAVLVGFGVDAVTQRRTGDARPAIRMRPGWSWLRPAVIAGGVLAVGVAILAKVRSTSISQGDWLVVKPTLYVPALLIAATFIVLALAATRRPWARWLALLALPLLVVGQGAYFFHRVLPGDNPDDFYRRTPVHQYLSQSLGHERYDTTGMVMYPSTSLYYGLRTATGHTTQPEQWIDLLRAVDPKVLLT